MPANENEPHFIDVNHVSFSYPTQHGHPEVPVLHDVSFSVDRGEYIAILGQNGSGKSTLAKMFNGLLVPTSGTVRILGMETTNHGHIQDIRSHVGMVFQNPETQMVATIVEEDVAFGLENLNLRRPEMHQRVTEALAFVDMEKFRFRPPHQLSGGQKQRVAIAGILAMKPSCIVFDEATSMLDAEGRGQVLTLMRTLHEEGFTIITITHDMEEAAEAERIIVINEGKLQTDGPPRQVFSQVAVLRGSALDVPVVPDMVHRLEQDGVVLVKGLLTPDEFSQALHRWAGPAVPAGTTEMSPASFHTAAPSPYSPIPNDQDEDEDEAADETHHRETYDGTAGPLVNHTESKLVSREGQGRGAERDLMIEIRNLSHVYMQGTPLAQTALEGISLTVYQGERVAVMGHTGSGKSTLMQYFNGIYIPTQGTVTVKGTVVRQHRETIRQVRRTVGLVFQNPEAQLFEALIGDDIAYGPFQYGLPLGEVRERVAYAMEMVGLDFAWRDRPVHALSGGQKRKVAIAGVLALRPQVLVLDEPTAGLDPKSRDDLLATLKRLNETDGTTIVMVSHRMEEVASLAERMIVLDAGRVVADGPVDQYVAQPELLGEWHLKPPETVRLLHRLAKAGWPTVEPMQLTRKQTYEELRRLIRPFLETRGGLR